MTTNANSLTPAADAATDAGCILEIRKVLAGRSLATLRDMRAAGKKHEPRSTDSGLVLAAIEAEIARLSPEPEPTTRGPAACMSPDHEGTGEYSRVHAYRWRTAGTEERWRHWLLCERCAAAFATTVEIENKDAGR